MNRLTVLLCAGFLSGCQFMDDFPPLGPGNWPAAYPLTQQAAFDLLLDSLNHAGATDLEKINSIRKYYAHKIDIGHSLELLNVTYLDVPWSQTSPFTCMDGFAANTLTAACGFSSAMLCRLYSYAGFESYQYHCGFTDVEEILKRDDEIGQGLKMMGSDGEPEHKLTLVNLNGSLIMQDAFYDITINDAAGSPKDFYAFLQEVKAGDFSNIEVVQETITSEMWLNGVGDFDSLQTVFGNFGTVVAVDTIGTRMRVMLQRNYSLSVHAAFSRVWPYLQAEGLAADYLSLYAVPCMVSNDDGSENDSLLQVINSVL